MKLGLVSQMLLCLYLQVFGLLGHVLPEVSKWACTNCNWIAWLRRTKYTQCSPESYCAEEPRVVLEFTIG